MYCAKCRTKILPGQKFCTECGAPVEAQYPLVPQSRSHEAHSGQYAVPTKQRNLFSWFIILVTIVLVELIVLIIIFFNIGKEPKIPTQNEDSVLPSQITPIEKGEPVPIAETTINTYQSDYVSRAIKIAEKEYSKHEKQEAAAAYMQEAMSNNITLDMLNRQPDYYVGKKVYFGGSVSQVIYYPDSPNDCEIRVNVRRTGEPNSHVYVAYTIKSGENRILENDFVNVYGTFLGLVTYETVLGNPITLPGIDAAYVYCTASTDGSVITPTMKEFEALISGSFLSERGEAFSFSTVRNGDDNYFADASDYGDCIVAYYLPIEGWDSSNPPPFYRVTAFRDGTMVIFEPSAGADVYTVYDGTYTIFTKTTSVPVPTETQVAEEPASAPAMHETIIGYVSPSSGGLKIRSGPSTSYEEVGRLSPGEMVEIYEIDDSGSRDWGRIDRGWVCMDYIRQDAPSYQDNGGYSMIFEQYKTAISSGYQNCGAYVSDSIVMLRQWGSEIAFSTMESISVLMGGIDTVTLTRTAEKKMCTAGGWTRTIRCPAARNENCL